jgi:membrane protein YqaA with SNARE-associated domain
MNRYYRITKFYPFLRDIAYKAGVTIFVFILLLVALELFVLDINEVLNNLVSSYAPLVVFFFFLVSETVLGIIPPEIFIGWAAKGANPWFYLFILATASYLGGVIAYGLGRQLAMVPAIKNYLEIKAAKHIASLRKWGGLFIVIGALLPVPHSIVSLAGGLINYNFKRYLLWALFRYARFAVYALVIFKIF